MKQSAIVHVIHTFHTHSVAVVHTEDAYCSYFLHTLTSTVSNNIRALIVPLVMVFLF